MRSRKSNLILLGFIKCWNYINLKSKNIILPTEKKKNWKNVVLLNVLDLDKTESYMNKKMKFSYHNNITVDFQVY